MKSQHYGATPMEWCHFDLNLGLAADLLPVVSNPAAVISPTSRLQSLGKTPSVYNGSSMVVGIQKWTKKYAAEDEIEAWSKDPDYGICLQTRLVRGLDIDVPDLALSAAIVAFVVEHLGQVLPARSRKHTGKILLAFELPGELPKRKMVVEGGIIEFLATGQQFVAIGTHPSGTRYEWEGGLPSHFPVLTLEQFNGLWQALADRFAIEAPTTSSVSVRRRGPAVAMADPVADYLRDQGRVLGEDTNGALLIECPWDAEHTTGEPGDGSTVWFPAGTNGYDKGHFKCLHGHCDGRTDGGFHQAVGYVEDALADFEVLPAVSREDGEVLDENTDGRPAYVRHPKTNAILVTADNMVLGVSTPRECGMVIGLDTFKDEIMRSTDGGRNWQPFTDADYTRVRIQLERKGFPTPPSAITREAVLLAAEENCFDSAQLWANRLVWDGVPRVEKFFADCWKAEDTAYTRAVSRYLWSALAGRVLEPGIKADMVPIAVGAQGERKSSAVAAMVPDPCFFAEFNLSDKDDDLSRRMRGKLIGEISELRGLHTRDIESIKAFITRQHEEWTPKYKEFTVRFPRRLVFMGTTNQEEFLADETGNRRWLPVKVGAVDVDLIEQIREQLWAEAVARFMAYGIEYADAEDLAEEAHEEHRMRDSWEETVLEWLKTKDELTGVDPTARGFLATRDVLIGALRFESKAIKRADEIRIGKVMKHLGFKKTRPRTPDGRVCGYVSDRTDHGGADGSKCDLL